MPMTMKQALVEALDDEYRARATYRAVLDAFGDVRPFIDIVESEERHIGALKRLFKRYQVDVPDDPWPGRIGAPESLEAACRAGVKAERENAALYETLLEAARGYPDVERTFRNLLRASQENHLPALERGARRGQRGDGSEDEEGGRRRRFRDRRWHGVERR